MCLSELSTIKPTSLLNMLFLFSAIRVIRIMVPVCAAVFLYFLCLDRKDMTGSTVRGGEAGRRLAKRREG